MTCMGCGGLWYVYGSYRGGGGGGDMHGSYRGCVKCMGPTGVV